MLYVATLGAGIAGWAAMKQQSGTSLERRVSQAQVMELADRLQLTDQSRTAGHLQERLDRHMADATAHQARARANATDARRARLSSLDAQESLLLANVIRPFVEHLPNIITPDLRLDERRIELVSAGSLQRKGFLAAWIEHPPGEPSAAEAAQPGSGHLDFQEKQHAETFDAQVLALAQVVVALVLALVFMTFADMTAQSTAIARICYAIAVLCAAAAIAMAIWIDRGLIVIVGWVTAASLVFGLIAYALGWLKVSAPSDEPLQTPGIDTQGFAGSQVQLQDASRTFQRMLIAAIAVAALASSVIGYWYTAASSRGDNANQDAYQQQLQLLKRSGRATTAVLGTFSGLVDLYERRVRCGMARNKAALARDGLLALTEKEAVFLEDMQCRGLEKLDPKDQHSVLLPELDQRFGPDADPRFPSRLQQHVAGQAPNSNSAEALALWDGFGELAVFWNSKTTSFLACLTIVAIALYVFGQALSMMQLRVSRALAASGVGMVVGAVAWSSAAWMSPMATSGPREQDACTSAFNRNTTQPEETMRIAARHYAVGSNLLAMADSEADFSSAISALECAIRSRPNFALAYHELGGAKALSHSAHKGQSYYSLPTKEHLDEIERNARATIRIQQSLGLVPNSYALNSHAVALWGIGIRDGKLESIAEALKLVENAITISEALESNRRIVSRAPESNLYPWLSVLPVLHLNRSLFLIALDRLEEGRVAIQEALALQVQRDWSLAGIMVTATRLLQATCETLHPVERCSAIRSALDAYRQTLLMGSLTAAASATPNRGQVTVSPSKVSFTARLPRFDPAKDRTRRALVRNRSAMGGARCPNYLVATRRGTRDEWSGNSAFAFSRSILPATLFRRCLTPGHYQADIFVNGQPAATSSFELRGAAMIAARLDALNLALCHPKGWQRWQGNADAPRPVETMTGFRNEEGRPIAFLFTFANPVDAQLDASEVAAYAKRRALQTLIDRGVLEGMVTDLEKKLKPCGRTLPGDLAVGTAAPGNGLAHVVLLLHDAMKDVAACDMMSSVTLMHAIPQVAR